MTMNNPPTKLYSLALILFCAAAASAAEIRLAIVSADARCAVAGELLTAEFARAVVERILREQP